MYQLSKVDYDRIFTFYSAINSDYANFENNILVSLATIFDLHLTAYTVFKLDSEGQMYVGHINSNSIPAEVIERYEKVLYKKDPFLLKYSQLCAMNPSSTFFTERALDPGEYQNSEYSRYLKKFNIAHEAIIGINDPNGNMINVIIYKAAGLGDFSEYEEVLFQYIGQMFNQSKGFFGRYIKQQRKIDALSEFVDEASLGFAVLDAKGRLLLSNSLFMIYGSRISSGLSNNAVVKDIVCAVWEDGAPHENITRRQMHIKNLCITIQKKRAVLAGRLDELSIITLKEDSGKRLFSPAPDELSSKYGFTRREAEVTLLVAKGYTNQEIADELYIGVTTVKSHIGNVFSKLSVNSRAELIHKLRTESSKK